VVGAAAGLAGGCVGPGCGAAPGVGVDAVRGALGAQATTVPAAAMADSMRNRRRLKRPDTGLPSFANKRGLSRYSQLRRYYACEPLASIDTELHRPRRASRYPVRILAAHS